MATRKPPARKKKKGKKKQNRNKKWNFRPFWFGIGAMFSLTLFFAVYFIFLYQPTGKMHRGMVPQRPQERPTQHDNLLIPEKDIVQEILEPVIKQRPSERELPKVAILIDDIGYRVDDAEKLLGLDLDISFAFLPHGPHTKNLSEKARRLGKDILLHFPMEPNDPHVKAGPGSVDIKMTRKEIKRNFRENMASVPWATGINNHMGSRFTQNRRAMQNFLELVRENGLYFIDSRTTPNSVGLFLAKEMGIKTAPRHVFLDNNHTKKDVIFQLEKLVKYAEEHGSAIGIGHPSETTCAALAEFEERYADRVVVVGVHTLVQ